MRSSTDHMENMRLSCLRMVPTAMCCNDRGQLTFTGTTIASSQSRRSLAGMHVVNSSADASWCSESMASAASLFRWQAPEVQSANASAPAAECKTAEPGDKCYKAL